MKNITVEDYFFQNPHWVTELTILRALIDETELKENIKWGMPVYTLKNKNVVGLAAFKTHFGLWFYKGSLMPDPDDILANAQGGKQKACDIYISYKDQ